MLDDKPTVLVATDFTPASRPAFEHGLALAQELRGRLLLVHAVRPLGAPGLELTRPDTSTVENETADPTPGVGLNGAEWADLAKAQGVDCELVSRPGLAAVVIREEAQRVDAHTIVLGSQHKTGLAKAILGSTADDVKEATRRPVVVVAGESPGDTRPPRPEGEPHRSTLARLEPRGP